MGACSSKQPEVDTSDEEEPSIVEREEASTTQQQQEDSVDLRPEYKKYGEGLDEWPDSDSDAGGDQDLGDEDERFTTISKKAHKESTKLWEIFRDYEVWNSKMNSRLDQELPSWFKAGFKFCDGIRIRLEAINRTMLSAEDKLSFRVFLPNILERLEELDYRPWHFATNQRKGLHMRFYRFCSRCSIRGQSSLEHFNSKTKKFLKHAQQLLDVWKEGVAEGRTLPAFAVEGIMKTIRSYLNKKDFKKSTFYTPFKKLPKNAKNWDVSAARKAGKEIVTTQIIPTYQRLLHFLQTEYLPHAREEVGLWSVPGGEAYYEFLIRSFTSKKDMTARKVHKIGLEEVERLKQEIISFVRDELKMEVPEQIGPQEFAKMTSMFDSNENMFFNEGDQPQKLYQATLEAAYGKLHNYFGKVPKSPWKCKSVSNSTKAAAYYTMGSRDMKRPGTVYVNIHNITARPRFMVVSLAMHEGVGHHVQLSLAHEFNGVPAFRRSRGKNLAFSEGWGVYMEWFGKVMGMYNKDKLQELGRLNGEIKRAARMVFDTGIHVMRWSKQQAMDWLRSITFLKDYEIQSEIERATVTPGKGTAYKVGLMHLHAQLDKVKNALGKKFTWIKFHDFILKDGALPLDILEENVDKWLRNLGRSRSENLPRKQHTMQVSPPTSGSRTSKADKSATAAPKRSKTDTQRLLVAAQQKKPPPNPTQAAAMVMLGPPSTGSEPCSEASREPSTSC